MPVVAGLCRTHRVLSRCRLSIKGGYAKCRPLAAGMSSSANGDDAVDIAQMRHPYKKPVDAFTEDQLDSKEPIGQFRAWFHQACQTEGILEPNAMCLSTATADGRPSARFVLLKGFGKDGFRFFTNYGSRKAKELTENPHAALTFYWEKLNRSIRIEGEVKKLPEEVSGAYFHSRPLGSQIGSSLSPQSQVISDRGVLEQAERDLKAKYEDGSQLVPLPNWGGYIVEPETVEFWQGQSTRIHDRIRFRRMLESDEENPMAHVGEDGWVYERLAP